MCQFNPTLFNVTGSEDAGWWSVFGRSRLVQKAARCKSETFTYDLSWKVKITTKNSQQILYKAWFVFRPTAVPYVHVSAAVGICEEVLMTVCERAKNGGSTFVC